MNSLSGLAWLQTVQVTWVDKTDFMLGPPRRSIMRFANTRGRPSQDKAK